MIYTIGYSCYTMDEFIEVLKTFKISTLIDVRTTPYSSFHIDFNSDILKANLKENGIKYLYLGSKVGGRPKNKQLYDDDGVIDYQKMEISSSFKKGIAEIASLSSSNVCLMCAEKNPINCHRSILIGKCLYNAGYDVLHIVDGIPLLTQGYVEDMLVKKHFPNLNQLSLFDKNEDYNSAVFKAYNMQNKVIGAKINEEECD